jgi:hypothetical protein
VPGLVHRTEPLAPGEAHVDPADPRGRRPVAGQYWLSWRMQLFTWLAPLLAAVAVVIAVDGRVWHPLLAAVLWLLSGVASWHARDRYERSARGPRDALRTSGRMLVALALFLGGIPFVAP